MTLKCKLNLKSFFLIFKNQKNRVTNLMEDNKNFSDAIKTENENLLSNKEISNDENKSRKKSDHKKFVFNTNNTK
jgi:hypothetical protein